MNYVKALMGRSTQRQLVSQWDDGCVCISFSQLVVKMEMVLKIQKGSKTKTPPQDIRIVWPVSNSDNDILGLCFIIFVSHSQLSVEIAVTWIGINFQMIQKRRHVNCTHD